MPLYEQTVWNIKPRDHGVEMQLACDAGVNSIVAAILRARGIDTPQRIQAHMCPSLNSLADPFSLPDMRAAAERIALAAGNGEGILIHGDYDADGITSTALLVRFLDKLGANVSYFIPHRLHDRYGLNPSAVDRAVEHNIGLIIAVDCGISDIDVIELAKQKGIDVIVVDHHEPGPQIPDTLVVDPKRSDSTAPFSEYAAVGLACRVAEAVCELLDMPRASVQRAFFDLVAIGTIADVADLTGDNRIMVKYGLQLLPNTQKVGLRALLDICGVNGQITSQDVGFRLAPRLNAVGRMADATDAVDLLICEDDDEAMQLAVKLEGLNRERQRIQERIFCDALARISCEVELDDEPVVCVGGEDWHIGVVGIVASKVVDRFHRPAFIACREDDTFRGSARSINGFNIAAALQSCSDLLLRFGGHELAGGFTVAAENFDAFRQRLNEIGRETLQPRHLLSTVDIDAEIDIEEIDAELVQAVREMGPFGHGNPEPVLMCSAVEVADVRAVGSEGAHLKLLIGEGHRVVDCIGFRMGDETEWLERGVRIDIAYTPEFNEYNGRTGIQLRIVAVRPTQ